MAAAILVAAVSGIEVWPDPPGWLRPERRVDLRVLHWLHIHWLNAAAVAAIAGFAAALIPLLIWLHERRKTERPPSQQARERDIMLRRMRRKWITDVLEPSLAHMALLILDLQTQPDVIHTPKSPAQGQGNRQKPVPEQKTILDIFEETAGSLAIVGAPGAGKTTLLLQLANALIDRAERDPSQAIPVVVNLESWASHRTTLDQWLLAELTGSYYKVPQNTATEWVETGELIFLLDGLDEVEKSHRRDCVAAINDYQRTHGLTGLVVCSRTRELQQMNVKLELEEAVELQPLTENQISDFLDRLEATGTPITMVRAELAADKTLKKLLSSPLTLNVVVLAYHGREPTALTHRGDIKKRQSMLWEAYVKRMFEQRPLSDRCRYTPGQAVKWLEWLALALQTQGESEFMLDRLTRQWIPEKPTQLRGPEESGPLDVGQRPGRTYIDLQMAMSLQSGRRHGRPSPGSMAGMVVLFTQLFGLLFATLITAIGMGVAVGLFKGPITGLISAAITIPTGLLLSFAFLTRGMVGDLELWSPKPNRPNEGIRRAARHAAGTALAAFLVFGGCAGVGFGFVGGPALGVDAAECIGLWFAFVLGIMFGGHVCLQHYSARTALVRAKAAPWRLEPFLNAMAARLLLLRSGGSYRFTHRLLRDYLADNAAHEELARETETLRAARARERSFP